jgi:hypothetical protein
MRGSVLRSSASPSADRLSGARDPLDSSPSDRKVMSLQPVQRDFDLSRAAALEDLALRVSEYFQGPSRQPSTNTRAGSVQLGSRLAHRFFGGMNAGRKLLPMIVNWTVASDGSGSQLRIALKSDEGGYAFATPWHYQSVSLDSREIFRAASPKFLRPDVDPLSGYPTGILRLRISASAILN